MLFNEQLPALMNVDEVLIYLRKSRADNPEETIEQVLSKHEKDIQDFAIRIFGNKIPEENIYREVVSGETIDARPEMKNVLSKISGPDKKAVIVYDVPRLSRGDWEDGGKILSAFKYSNTFIITLSKIFDLNDPSGYDYKMFKAELSAGYEFLEYTKATLRRGVERSIKKGNYLGSVAPYGYRKIVLEDKSPTLEIDENEADGVIMMFELYASGVGTYRIKKELDNSPYYPRNGRKWSEPTIRRMLQSPVYIGRIRWNYRKSKKVYEDGTIKKIRPLGTDDEIMIIDGKHPPIINQELWDKVQALFGTHTKEKSNTELRNPYATLLKCHCGQSMLLVSYKETENRKPRIRCKYQVDCKTMSTNFEDVHNRIISLIELHIKDFEFKRDHQDLNMISVKEKMLEDLQKQLNKLNDKEEEIYDFLEDGIYTKEMFLKRKSKNDEKINEVKEKIKNAKASIPVKIDYDKKIFKFKEVVEALKDDDVKPKEKNILLKEIIDKIVYNRQNDAGKRFDTNNFSLEIFFKE